MNAYKNQIFISYARAQRSTVEGFVNELLADGLTVWWDKNISLGVKWPEEIDAAIHESRHFLLYCTVQAKASEEVKQEIRKFLKDAKGDPSRKIFVLKAPDCDDKYVPSELDDVERADSLKDVIIDVLKEARHELDQRFREFERNVEKEKETLKRDLTNERAKVDEARKYYGHRRFWRPFAEKKDVHIFTCGRDSPLMIPTREVLGDFELALTSGTIGLSSASRISSRGTTLAPSSPSRIPKASCSRKTSTRCIFSRIGLPMSAIY